MHTRKKSRIGTSSIAMLSNSLMTQSTKFSSVILDLIDLIVYIKKYVQSPAFASLFDIRTLLNLSLVCKTFSSIFNSQYFQMVIWLGNLEPELQPSFWAKYAPWIR